MSKTTENKPVAVSEKTIRSGELLGLMLQVEPTVWTERMLTALIQGVKGGKWFSLIAGRTLSLPNRGCTACEQPMRRRVNPLRGKTTNRRAVCGKSACTVRRGEGLNSIDPSYPYRFFRLSRERKATKNSHLSQERKASAPVIALDQQGESPCRGALASRNRR
jgi:hypothetical protein